MANAIGSYEAIWKSIYQSSRMRKWKTPSLTKFALGLNGVLPCWVSRSHPFPYAICLLQGYPGELVRGLGTYITLDDVLAILDEHYNNVKALDALNNELFQLWIGEKQTVLDWGCICWGTSKFWQHDSCIAFCQATLLNWSVTTCTVGCLKGSKQW